MSETCFSFAELCGIYSLNGLGLGNTIHAEKYILTLKDNVLITKNH
jgi:hypothetical protein